MSNALELITDFEIIRMRNEHKVQVSLNFVNSYIFSFYSCTTKFYYGSTIGKVMCLYNIEVGCGPISNNDMLLYN